MKLIKLQQHLQSVNTINNKDGILKGYNTDVEGFIFGTKKVSNLI